ncbi:hypothetical protein NUM3379_05400 [Kineococcus sp. NUM-3379]
MAGAACTSIPTPPTSTTAESSRTASTRPRTDAITRPPRSTARRCAAGHPIRAPGGKARPGGPGSEHLYEDTVASGTDPPRAPRHDTPRAPRHDTPAGWHP